MVKASGRVPALSFVLSPTLCWRTPCPNSLAVNGLGLIKIYQQQNILHVIRCSFFNLSKTCKYLLSGEELDDDEDLNQVETS